MYNFSLMRYIIPILAGLSLFCGCGAPRQPYVTSDRLQRGLVLVLPGIEGRSYFNEAICKGLNNGGVNWAIELSDWTSYWGMLYNLRAEERNRRQAEIIANRIERYKVAFPDRPVMLVGQSGGGAMAVWAAEALNPEQKIDGLVLINPSLSPQYVLLDALARTNKGIVLLYSPKDWMLLGLGTTVYGTMDGEYGSSAGFVGFEVPTDRPRLYKKLYQISWTKKMAKAGHSGGHLSSGAAKFVARYVAPLIRSEEWSKNLMARIKKQDYLQTADSPTESPDDIDTPIQLENEFPATRAAEEPDKTSTRPTSNPTSKPLTNPIVPLDKPKDCEKKDCKSVENKPELPVSPPNE